MTVADYGSPASMSNRSQVPSESQALSGADRRSRWRGQRALSGQDMTLRACEVRSMTSLFNGGHILIVRKVEGGLILAIALPGDSPNHESLQR